MQDSYHQHYGCPNYNPTCYQPRTAKLPGLNRVELTLTGGPGTTASFKKSGALVQAPNGEHGNGQPTFFLVAAKELHLNFGHKVMQIIVLETVL